MTAGVYDMVVEQGATYTLNMTWRDPEAAPIDLTGYSARLQARARGGEVLVEMNTENGDITLGDEDGTIQLRLNAATTSGLQAGIYRYDLEVETGEGEVTRLLRGQFIVEGEITK